MMENFRTYILYVHILAGGVSLIAGLIPMLSKKGSQLHIQLGKVYFWVMFVIFVTALLRFRPEMKLIFLSCIAIFSFYMTFTGRRLIQMKNNILPKLWDWVALSVAFGFALMMAGIAFWGGLHQNLFLAVVLGLFSLILFSFTYKDYLLFTGKAELEHMHWFMNHIARMVGSYIATVTAFVVVNNKGFLPDLVAWIAPTVIGVYAIIKWRSYYRAKFNKVSAKPVQV